MNNFGLHSIWAVECIGSDGEVKWIEEVKNRVVNEGLDWILNTLFNSVGYTSTFYVGLKGAGSISANDTLSSHGWLEIEHQTAYTGNRPATGWNNAVNRVIDNEGQRPEFNFISDRTVVGCFLTTSATGNGSPLISVINFLTARDVLAGDTLRVSIKYNIAAT